MLGQCGDTRDQETAAIAARIPKALPTDQSLDPNLVVLRGLALPENGAGDGNRIYRQDAANPFQS